MLMVAELRSWLWGLLLSSLVTKSCLPSPAGFPAHVHCSVHASMEQAHWSPTNIWQEFTKDLDDNTTSNGNQMHVSACLGRYSRIHSLGCKKQTLFLTALEARKSKIRVCGESPPARVPMAPSPCILTGLEAHKQSVHRCYLSWVCTSQSFQVGPHGSIFPRPLTWCQLLPLTWAMGMSLTNVPPSCQYEENDRTSPKDVSWTCGQTCQFSGGNTEFLKDNDPIILET